MKRFLCTCAFVAAVAMLLTFSPNQSLTAETNSIGSFYRPFVTVANDPIKVLGVKLSTNPKTKRTASGIEGLEVTLQNTSNKPIQYLVIHAEIPISKTAESPVRVPLGYGKAPVPNSKSRTVVMFEPGAKITLNAPQATLDNINKQIGMNGRIPAAEEIQTKFNVAIFKDGNAWAGGQLNYPDPTDPSRWIAGEELTRNNVFDLGAKYSSASYKANTNDCYRFTGIQLKYCCSYCCNGGEMVDLNVAEFHFQGDPSGHFQPNLVEACCPLGGSCCSYFESAGCS